MHYLIEQNKIHVDFRIDETGKTLLCPHWYNENTNGLTRKQMPYIRGVVDIENMPGQTCNTSS